MGNKKEYKRRLTFVLEDVREILKNLPSSSPVLQTNITEYTTLETHLSNIEIASDLSDDESTFWKTKFDVPTHDPQTGELNPYYEELTGKKNPLVNPDLVIEVPPRMIREDFKKEKDIDKMPNQKWHQIVSFIKSGVRIVGYCFIPFNLVMATTLLVLSEVIGIIEELV
jgi:hypothetical protein